MTVASETTITSALVFNGVTTTFAYPFRILDDDELVVVSIDDTSGILSVIDSSAYSVTGVGEASGGNIVFSAAPSSGATGYALRECDFTQQLNLTEYGPFFASSIMRALDHTAMRLLQLREVSYRTLRGRPGETYDYLPPKADLANALLGGDADGNPKAYASEGSATVIGADGGGEYTASVWFTRMARGADYPEASLAYFSNRTPTDGTTFLPLRITDRVLGGVAAYGEEGTFDGSGDTTWVTDNFNHYLARGSHWFVISPSGGAPLVSATRRSDIYDGNPVWQPSLVVTAGQKYGYIASNGAHTLYLVTVGGTFDGSTPPTHTSGSAANGTATLQFIQHQYRTTIGGIDIAYNDVADGGPVWGRYIEVVRKAGAGDTQGIEVDVKNGGSAVNHQPWSMHTPGKTQALWIGSGPDGYGDAIANPATVAIGIVNNGGTFYKGITFGATALADEGGGIYCAIALGAPGTVFRQYASDGTAAASISFAGTAFNQRVTLSLQPRAIYAFCQGAVMGGFISVPPAGTAPDLYVGLEARPSSDGYVSASPYGSLSDTGFIINSKGAASVIARREDSSTNTVVSTFVVRRATSGTPGVGIGATLAFEVETAADNLEIGGKISAVSTSVTGAAEVFDMVFSVMTGGASVDRLRLTPTALLPEVDDGLALGSSSKRFSDADFADGAVIRFNNAYTLTHATGQLTANGNLILNNTGATTLLRIGNANAAAASLVLSNAAGQLRQIRFQTAQSERWNLSCTTTAEGGANAGSDFLLLAYDDTGTLIGTALAIARATRAATFGGSVRSTSASGGIGYNTGAGGTVTQGTSKSQGVTLDKICGQITTHNATLNAGAEVGFTLTNSAIAAADVVVVSIASGATADAYQLQVDATGTGSCRISLTNVSGSNLGEAIVINFVVIKSVTA